MPYEFVSHLKVFFDKNYEISISCICIIFSVKQEAEEMEVKKSEVIFKPPPLPEPEVLSELLHKWSLSKGDELFFMQLPDSLPGQPPTREHRPVKTEVQSEDGQSVLLKTETQVGTTLPVRMSTEVFV